MSQEQKNSGEVVDPNTRIRFMVHGREDAAPAVLMKIPEEHRKLFPKRSGLESLPPNGIIPADAIVPPERLAGKSSAAQLDTMFGRLGEMGFKIAETTRIKVRELAETARGPEQLSAAR